MVVTSKMTGAARTRSEIEEDGGIDLSPEPKQRTIMNRANGVDDTAWGETCTDEHLSARVVTATPETELGLRGGIVE